MFRIVPLSSLSYIHVVGKRRIHCARVEFPLGNTEIANYALLNLPYLAGPAGYNRKFRGSRAHPIYAWLGLRPVLAQHTSSEHEALERWASGRPTIVEIGVAEGVSALALRQSMAANGTLYLIDPFPFSRNRILNFTKRTAHQWLAGFPGEM